MYQIERLTNVRVNFDPSKFERVVRAHIRTWGVPGNTSQLVHTTNTHTYIQIHLHIRICMYRYSDYVCEYLENGAKRDCNL